MSIEIHGKFLLGRLLLSIIGTDFEATGTDDVAVFLQPRLDHQQDHFLLLTEEASEASEAVTSILKV